MENQDNSKRGRGRPKKEINPIENPQECLLMTMNICDKLKEKVNEKDNEKIELANRLISVLNINNNLIRQIHKNLI